MQERISFHSDGLKLSAVIHVPEARKPGQRLPAFIVLHGFVGSKDESHAEIQARMLEEMGYVALRFDFRCCGESDGERAQVRCFDQVADAKNVLHFSPGEKRSTPSGSGRSATASARLSRLCGGCRRPVCLRDLILRLGRRRAEIPRPASDARSLGEVHLSPGKGPQAPPGNG